MSHQTPLILSHSESEALSASHLTETSRADIFFLLIRSSGISRVYSFSLLFLMQNPRKGSGTKIFRLVISVLLNKNIQRVGSSENAVHFENLVFKTGTGVAGSRHISAF